MLHLVKSYVTKQRELQAYEGGLTPYRLQQAINYIHAYLLPSRPKTTELNDKYDELYF